MGQAFRKLLDTSEMRVVMLGLDAAGNGQVLSTVPTIGFNVEKVEYKNVGGQEKLRPLWRHYFNNTDGLIYVVDSVDRERMGRAKAEFELVRAKQFFHKPSPGKLRLDLVSTLNGS